MKPALLGLLIAAGLAAHDLAVLPRVAGEAIVVAAHYGGTEPAAFCLVSVFSPAKADAEFQTGRTDARGRFAFLPDVPGQWRIVVDDEMGHRQEATLEWSAAVPPTAASSSQPPWQKALTGGALLLGLTGIWLWWSVRDRL